MTARGTVLLIEDEEAIADLVRMYFEKDGFRVVHASTGEQGLDAVRDRSPRVVLLDLGLPGMDGLEVCRRIRGLSDVPIIMLTARDAEIDKVVGLEMGADDYLTKPFSPRELSARVKAVLRRSEEKPREPTTLQIGEWTVDGGRREARLDGGDPVRPTAREFDLLWFLCENQGLVLSRDQILQNVWGYEYFGETRTVDVHIRQLRKKLEGFPIETVWGVGYRVKD